MSLILDWLFGENDANASCFSYLDKIAEAPLANSDAAPILKLNAAILQQAVGDRAERIDLKSGIPDLEYPTCESFEQHSERQRRENPVTPEDIATARKREEFRAMMLRAGIGIGVEDQPASNPDKLTVTFNFQGLSLIAMVIPVSLLGPCIRAYPFDFNYQRCASVGVPENLVYVEANGNAAFASIDHYDRKGPHYMGICLDYEDEQGPRK